MAGRRRGFLNALAPCCPRTGTTRARRCVVLGAGLALLSGFVPLTRGGERAPSDASPTRGPENAPAATPAPVPGSAATPGADNIFLGSPAPSSQPAGPVPVPPPRAVPPRPALAPAEDKDKADREALPPVGMRVPPPGGPQGPGWFQYQQNLQNWQRMSPEQRAQIRAQVYQRLQVMRQEADRSLDNSNLRLDPDRRKLYVMRYIQERRRLERDLREKMENERKRRLPQIVNDLRTEFQELQQIQQELDEKPPAGIPPSGKPPAGPAGGPPGPAKPGLPGETRAPAPSPGTAGETPAERPGVTGPSPER